MQNVNEGGGQAYLLSYHSNVIRRVCRSTLQAQTLSMIAGYEEAEHLRGDGTSAPHRSLA